MPRASNQTGANQDQEHHIIEREADAFFRRHYFHWNDVDDLISAGWEAWLRQRDNYAADRGASRDTFLKRVIGNAFTDLLRAELAESRSGDRRAHRLDNDVADGITLGELVPGPGGWDPGAGIDRLDIREVLARLSPRQRAQLEALLAGYGVTETADLLGVHRDTLHSDMQRIRAVFRTEGFA